MYMSDNLHCLQLFCHVSTTIIPTQIQLPFPTRQVVTATEANASLPPQLVNIDIGVLLCPLQDQMAAKQMSVLEGGVRVFRFLPREELQERETARAVIEFLRYAY
ncbi:hypothetical protein NM688_g7287 [Phlebia brevispora]|uniref:Uncharacterized protein n=1 Tax=Phlebia brevispora TaxID=194682 RepID=A0ACC1S730_9APHY|nr:hypothetical protein NM688_g7287 [Phlebia brevispora]